MDDNVPRKLKVNASFWEIDKARFWDFLPTSAVFDRGTKNRMIFSFLNVDQSFELSSVQNLSIIRRQGKQAKIKFLSNVIFDCLSRLLHSLERLIIPQVGCSLKAC